MAAAVTVTAMGRLQFALSQAASWWLEQWRASLPEALRTASTVLSPFRLAIHDTGHYVSLTLISPDASRNFAETYSWSEYDRPSLERCLARAKRHLGCRDLTMSLVTTSAISGSLPIPLQARAQADAIVRDHIARRTPLPLDDMFIGHELRPSEAGKLDLDYLVLPRTYLDDLLSRLGLESHEVYTLEGPSGSGSPVVVPLSRRKERSSLMGKIACVLTLAGVAALAIAFCVQVWRQAEILDGIEARLAHEVLPAHQSTGRLRSVFGMAEDIARMAEMRSSPGVVRIWEELSRVIPDSTYLTEFEVQEAEIIATGYSDTAPELIRILEESTVLHGASFTGSVVQDRTKGKEQFALRALLRKPRLPVEEDR